MKLLDWKGRFNPSDYKCPQCGNRALDDNWPPNYYVGGGPPFSWSGSQKIVCLECKIAMTVNYESDGSGTRIEYGEIHALVEQDGNLLTPHDVWRQEHKEELEENPMLDAWA